jgi:tRNA(His) 5'-end guanylyltransferase
MPSAPPLGTPEFERLLNRLAEDIVDAAVFQRLRENLNASYDEYWREFNESQTFWSLSLPGIRGSSALSTRPHIL